LICSNWLKSKTTSSDHYVSDTLKNLTFYQNLADAVKDADFIQENGPERIDLKKTYMHSSLKTAPKIALSPQVHLA
jgi:3-hydroxyacyl-CoA dehydrogenase